jgi:hypothetical protein
VDDHYPGCRKSFLAVPDSAYAIGVVDAYNSSSNNGAIDFHFAAPGKTEYINYPDGNNGWSIPDSTDYNDFVAQFNITPPGCH